MSLEKADPIALALPAITIFHGHYTFSWWLKGKGICEDILMEAFYLLIKKMIRNSTLPEKPKITELWSESLDRLMLRLFLILGLTKLMVCENI